MAKRKILITLGDPAGIGPEVIQAALAAPGLPPEFDYEIVGDPSAGVLGKPDERSALASLNALEEAATRWISDPGIAAVVTGPVAKSQLERVGFRHPGQTEFFAEKAGVRDFAMCLTGDHLTVGLATIHIPYQEVARSLSTDEIVRIGLLLAGFARQKLRREPVIAVAGLNPHAGESGKFGREEIELIAPAIAELSAIDDATFVGPCVPDAVFRDAAQGRFDAVLAMYHDQGLIPLKLIDFDTAVNVTLGLPKPRTSPDHGTAFDIAGKGLASPSSMIAAIHTAARLAGPP
ncbi:4-hydroxythreonine-4-phosphate dehydrogenase [Haloferula luteola]|uniref:4-hydroxythreonine-4-phosphate dehydrogenase n=1 Tax=Haloferula luteola TaxID=595692 RepID=A0A840V107_9BACT|nr:4-hydroxythreonine-4-phosphate dehydrogenase PdxA [Haloferula luteola]MBB5352037.1 4-hydroxythreonine-4-phosphate dehydrogenase [Haloferula luteola]